MIPPTEPQDLLNPYARPMHGKGHGGTSFRAKMIQDEMENEKNTYFRVYAEKNNPLTLNNFLVNAVSKKVDYLRRNDCLAKYKWEVRQTYPQIIMMDFLKMSKNWPDEIRTEVETAVKATGESGTSILAKF
jgi:hypothetical protein